MGFSIVIAGCAPKDGRWPVKLSFFRLLRPSNEFLDSHRFVFAACQAAQGYHTVGNDAENPREISQRCCGMTNKARWLLDPTVTCYPARFGLTQHTWEPIQLGSLTRYVCSHQ